MASESKIVEACFDGESKRGLRQKFDVCRKPIPIRVEKWGRGKVNVDAIDKELIPDQVDEGTITQFPNSHLQAIQWGKDRIAWIFHAHERTYAIATRTNACTLMPRDRTVGTHSERSFRPD